MLAMCRLFTSIAVSAAKSTRTYMAAFAAKNHMENSRIRRKKPYLIADLHTSPPTSGAGSRSSHEGQED